MLTQDFCNFLEYHLTKAFACSTDDSVKGFWCDGVLLPLNENDYSKKTINDTRKVIVKAFIGKNGQDEYSLLMKFGNKALSKYAKDLDIKDCLPKADERGWYEIDPEKNKIIIQLL